MEKVRLHVETLAVESFPTSKEEDKAAARRDGPPLDAEALAATSRPVRPPYCTC